MAAKKVTKAKLAKVAEELNKVLGLEPKIDSKGSSVTELQEAIIEAAELLEPEDELSAETLEIINDLIGQQSEEGEEEAAEASDEATAEETEDEVPSDPEPEKKEESKPAPKKNTKVMTRPQALAKALKMTEGEFTVDEIVSSARKIYEAANKIRDKSDSGSKAEWDVVHRALLAVGVLHPGKREKSFVYTGPREDS